jgi:hypothetical protein
MQKHLYAEAVSRNSFRMRTTFDLPDPLFRDVKTRAVQQGVKLKDLLASYVEAGLRGQSAASPAGSMRQRFPLPIARRADGTVTRALTNKQLQAILDEEDRSQPRKPLPD